MDKPPLLTSHDVVARLRRLTGEKKAGHTGTLDPIATGVLVVCFGAATKTMPYLPEATKTYRVEAVLGSATDTQDRTGRVLWEKQDFFLPYDALYRTLLGFLGASRQVPPMYSAVQVGGERLYRLARAGVTVPRQAREITIGALSLESPAPAAKPALGYGDRVIFTVTGSKGLYVRTLCHDLGEKLGCGAHLAELRRLASGPFNLTEAVTLEELTAQKVGEHLLGIDRVLGHLPALQLGEELAARVVHGNQIEVSSDLGQGLARAVGPAGRTIAVLERRGTIWQPLRVF